MSDDYSYDGDDFETNAATATATTANDQYDDATPIAVASASAYEESLADADMSSPPAPTMKMSPQPSRLPVRQGSTIPLTPSEPIISSSSSSLDSPRRAALLAQNPTLARLNKNLDALKLKGASMAAEHDERISARAAAEATSPGRTIGASQSSPLSPNSSDLALTNAAAMELAERLRRELASTKSKLGVALKKIDELQHLREEDSLRAKKAQRNDKGKLDAQQLANANKKLEIYKKANEVLRNQINSSLNPDKYSSRKYAIMTMQSHAIRYDCLSY